MIKDDDPKKKADATQQQVFSEEDINAAGAAAKKGAAGKIGFTPKLTDKEISDPNIAPSGSHDGLGSPYYAQRVFMKGKDGGPAKSAPEEKKSAPEEKDGKVTDGFRRRLLRYLDGLETREEREKREKREARNRMFAAIGDGISAISNLFTTKAGAPNMYDHSKGMTQAYNARLEQLRKERKAREDEFLNAYKMFDRAYRDDYSKSYTDAKVANIASQIEAREKKAENAKALA